MGWFDEIIKRVVGQAADTAKSAATKATVNTPLPQQPVQTQPTTIPQQVSASNPFQQAVQNTPIQEAVQQTSLPAFAQQQTADRGSAGGAFEDEPDKKKSSENKNAKKQSPMINAIQSALNADVDQGLQSNGGKFNMTPEEYMQAMANIENNEGMQDISRQYWKSQADEMGGAAGMANPVGAGFRGAIAGIKAAKAGKAAEKAAKLEEKAAKAAEKAGIAGSKEAKAVEAAAEKTEPVTKKSMAENALKAAEEADDIQAASIASKQLGNEVRREKMLTNEEGYFGNAAKNAMKDFKPTTAKDLAIPSAIGGGLLASTAAMGAVDPSFLEKPLAESIAPEVEKVLEETGWDTGAIGENVKVKNPGDTEAGEHPYDEDYMDAAAPGFTGQELGQTYYGYTPNEINQLLEYQLIDAAINDPTYRANYENAGYLDPYSNYVALTSLDDTNNYDDRREVFRDILGLNPENPDLEIQGLQQIFKEAGTINDDMTDDEKLDAVLYKQFVDNLIDANQWMSNTEYAAANPFGGEDLAKMEMDYWRESGMMPVLDELIGQLGNNSEEFTADDVVRLANAWNVANQMYAGEQFDPSLWGGESGFLSNQDEWKWMDRGGTDEQGYSSNIWKPRYQNYSLPDIGSMMQAIYENPEDARYYEDLIEYRDNIDDYLASVAEETDRQRRRVGRKES